MNNKTIDELTSRLAAGGHQVSRSERRVIERVAKRLHISRDTEHDFDEAMSFGDRVADRIASFGGSWSFILGFLGFLAIWVLTNAVLLTHEAEGPFDPYPFVFLNLILSMIAALQAPVIMMSQNRQASKDRQMAGYDYAVNLKAELEIMALHEKMDAMRSDQIMRLLDQQQAQLDLLTRLVERAGDAANPPSIP